MSTLVVHSRLLTVRSVRTLVRQPWFVAVTLVQPIVWLLLFGALFSDVVDIPGFDAATGSTGSYLEFLTPGVVMMTALFASGWAGTVYIDDMNRGVMDRLLASPVRRGAMMVGTLAHQTISTVIQTLIVVVVAVVSGARFPDAAVGLPITLLAASLLTIVFAALSNAVALMVRQQEALIGISQFVSLPLSFLSSAIMDLSLAPAWLRTVARYNPVDWAVVAARETLGADPDWSAVLPRLGGLGVLALAMSLLASRAFGAYQRSL